MKNNKLMCERAFTLIEMIGVLAIMATLAAIIAPNVIKQLQSARQDVEEKTLSILLDGLESYILENRIIPQSGYGSGTWATNIASQTDLPAKDVYQNDIECSRRYWFDPSTSLNGLSGGSAYNQNMVSAANISGYTTGSTASAPTNPRAMIISDLAPGCTNDINSVDGTDAAKFSAVWEQANSGTDPLVEGDTLKIDRINLSQIFETITLQAGYSSIFARKTYSNPSFGTDTPSLLMTIERNSHIYSVSYSTGGFAPTNIPGGSAKLGIGHTSLGGNEFVPPASTNVTTGFISGPISVNYTSTADISVFLELTISGTNVYNGNSGYIDTTVEYNGEPQYKLEGQSDPTVIIISDPGIPEIISFNVINGTELSLYDQSWIGTGDGDLLYSVVIKESESFYYSPGPPTLWGR